MMVKQMNSLEEAVSLQRQIAKSHDIVIVEGLVPTARDAFASDLNASLAQALDAKVIFVSNANIEKPEQTAEKVEAQVRNFGGASSSRNAGVLFMRTRGLPAESAQIPVTIDPSLRLVADTEKFKTEIQKTYAHIGSAAFPIIGLVPFSDTLSVPRISDLAKQIQATWINQGKANTRRVLHSSLIASNIEHELQKFVAGELIISASDRIDVLLASSLATSNGIPLAGLVLTEHHEPNPLVLEFCQSAIKNGLPILHTPLSTFETAQQLANLSNEIPVDDTERRRSSDPFRFKPY